MVTSPGLHCVYGTFDTCKLRHLVVSIMGPSHNSWRIGMNKKMFCLSPVPHSHGHNRWVALWSERGYGILYAGRMAPMLEWRRHNLVTSSENGSIWSGRANKKRERKHKVRQVSVTFHKEYGIYQGTRKVPKPCSKTFLRKCGYRLQVINILVN